MRNIGESRIYVVPELSTDNEQWINPDFGTPELRTHYDNIKQMVKNKTGRAMQEKERDDRRKTRPVAKVSKSSKASTALLEIDLHAAELLDDLRGLSPADILNYQIDTFRKVMDENLRNIGREIVFIHGKGEGVLRGALMKELNHRYKGHDVADASFREYGFGATKVTIRKIK